MSKTTRKVRIFSALEVANLCGVVNQTAINWIRNGHLKAFTTPGGQYRVYAEDLRAFLEGRGMRIPAELNGKSPDDVDWTSLVIIDDDRELNDLMKRFFEKRMSSFAIFQAFDGFEAGRILAEKRPGFVLLDIDLPGVSGHSLCKRIKADPSFGKPYVVAITGLDRPEERSAMIADGADAFFPKPLDFDMVAASLLDYAGKVQAKVES
jgi:two-component system, OmpR family, response regulator